MTPYRRANPRAAYHLRRAEEANKSASLSAKFPKLKALTVTLDYFHPAGTARHGGMKYKLNLHHAKSLFCINCVHDNCAGADYDLSEVIAQTVTARQMVAEGELHCRGTRLSKDPQQAQPCQSILRYKLTLGY